MINGIGSKIRDNLNNTYELDEILGEGGFGVVYKAHNINDGSVVAVKIFNSLTNPESFLSLKKEMNQLRLTNTEHVAKYLYVHDGKTYPDYPCYIIMEYCDNGTLNDLITKQNGKHLSNEEIKSLLLQLANAMKCVNEYLVHRDIKPDNILNFNRTLKITDFGLSKIVGESTKTLTFKNSGTFRYMAPEAWDNSENTIQMDIYSMGIVFYEVATLSYPYVLPENISYSSLKSMHLYDPIIDPRTRNPNLSSDIASVIIKMLEKPTQKRFSNWDEIIEILRSEISTNDEIDSMINKAIAKRNMEDLQIQKQKSEREKQLMLRDEKIKIAYTQYKNEVLGHIDNIVLQFNTKYSGDNKISIKNSSPNIRNPHFSTIISTPAGNVITICGEILFKENFTKPVKYDTCEELGQENYLPECDGREIIMWCQIKDMDGYGFNILLLRVFNKKYGDFCILENFDERLPTQRVSPFGFDLSELPYQMRCFRMQDIFHMKFEPYDKNKIVNFILERV